MFRAAMQKRPAFHSEPFLCHSPCAQARTVFTNSCIPHDQAVSHRAAHPGEQEQIKMAEENCHGFGGAISEMRFDYACASIGINRKYAL